MKSTALTALSYAAILTVYAAGYERTREAADRFPVDIPTARPYQITLPDGTSVTAARPFAALPSMGPAPPATAPARAMEPTAPEPAPPKLEARVSPAPAPKPSPGRLEPPSVVASAAAVPSAPVVAAPVTEPRLSAAPPEIPAPEPVILQTGKFRGWGNCRHGDIEAEVEIARGMIVDVKITQCKVQYSCGDLYELSEAVFEHQGPSANYVAGATQSTIAYYTAILNALDKAK